MTAALEAWGCRLTAGINRISTKQMAVCAAVLFVISVLPILLLGKYNVMCIDDYDYGVRIRDVWLATGSFGQSVNTAIEQMKELYMSRQGTYVSCILMGLCPMNFRYETAFVVPIIMIGMFAFSTFLLGRQILIRWLGSDKQKASFVMFLLLFLFYQVMEAPFEGIFWYNGAIHYILMESVLFLVLTMVSENIWTEEKKGTITRCVLASAGGIIVGGGNLVTGLQAEVMLVLLLIGTYMMRREKIGYTLIPFLTFTAGFLCNVLAPGNTAKTNAIEANLDANIGYAPVLAVLLSFYYAVLFIIEWTGVLTLLVWLALLPVMWQIGKKSERNFAHPLVVTMGAFCIVSAMFTPTLFALGTAGLSRVDNIIQMVYYLCLFSVTTYWFGWSSRRVRSKKNNANIQQIGESAGAGKQFGKFLESTGNVMTVVCLFLVLTVWMLTADKNTYTSVSALRSLVKGETETYYAEAMERHELYIDETVKDVVVHPFSAKPALFDFEDLSEDSGNWLNQAVTAYYHKNSVKMEPGRQ